MSKLEAEFTFEIGEIVAHAGHVAIYGPVPAMPLVVIERVLQECHGGVQKHYRCRPLARDARDFRYEGTAQIRMNQSPLFELTELECVPFPDEGRAAALKERADLESRIRQLERQVGAKQ